MRFRQLEQIIAPDKGNRKMAKKTFGTHLKRLVEEGYINKTELEKQKTVYSISLENEDKGIFNQLNDDIKKLKKQLRGLTPIEKSEKVLEAMKILSFAEWYDLMESEINSKSKDTATKSETIHTMVLALTGAILTKHKSYIIKLVLNGKTENNLETYKLLQKQLYRETLRSYSSLKL
jgi:DNA-binding HxlR family transcriptional regulator